MTIITGYANLWRWCYRCVRCVVTSNSKAVPRERWTISFIYLTNLSPFYIYNSHRCIDICIYECVLCICMCNRGHRGNLSSHPHPLRLTTTPITFLLTLISPPTKWMYLWIAPLIILHLHNNHISLLARLLPHSHSPIPPNPSQPLSVSPSLALCLLSSPPRISVIRTNQFQRNSCRLMLITSLTIPNKTRFLSPSRGD